MRVPVTLVHLEAFLEIADSLSFARAAEALHVSQPALTRTIQIAERQLKTRLFDRNTHSVTLTASGRELVPVARRLLAEFEGAFSALAQFVDGFSGRVTVGCMPSVGVALLPQAMAAFCANHPNVEFNCRESRSRLLLEGLIDGGLDLALTTRPPDDPRFQYLHLLRDEICFVCKEQDAPSDLKAVGWGLFEKHGYIASTAEGQYRATIEEAMAQAGISVGAACECSSMALIGAMIRRGLGAAAVPRLAMSLMGTDGLSVLPLHEPSVGRDIGVVILANRTLSRAATNFIDLLMTLNGSAAVT
jgi:LysR family carnitine catabolism transcriptional activator